jgi:arsenate reductase-like glutaredoxin family protein
MSEHNAEPEAAAASRIDRSELCEWLRQNSSGTHRKLADAADAIEQLERERDDARTSELCLEAMEISRNQIG